MDALQKAAPELPGDDFEAKAPPQQDPPDYPAPVPMMQYQFEADGIRRSMSSALARPASPADNGPPLDAFYRRCDGQSLVLTQQLKSTHKSHPVLQQALQEGAAYTARTVEAKERAQLEISAEQLRAGLVHGGERVAAPVELRYLKIEFEKVKVLDSFDASRYEGATVPGTVLLTNKRVIFMSSVDVNLATFEAVNNAKRQPGAYRMTQKQGNNTWYFPIGLSRLNHISLESGTMSSSTGLVSAPPCCHCLGPRYWFCNCVPCWAKKWIFQPDLPEPSLVYRHIRLALVMPPWDDNRVAMKIHLDPAQSMDEVKQWINSCQTLAKSLADE